VATVEEIFLAALEKAPADRAVYLDAACSADAELRAQVEALLRSHEEAGSLLEQPLFQPAATVDYSPAAVQAGAVIGPYKLVEQIGEGGMGTVWMAQQTEPVKRLVAVKLIKAGMDSKQVIARFEAERQALALMDHPNIARVLDAGTVGKDEGGRMKDEKGKDAASNSSFILHPSSFGRPYFVMDLVRGVPITKYCDDHHLTPRQRLELFLPVCQAIQHAHQKGIIHRDLKPSNVLVALYDGKAVPKVIDFGVAKAAGQQLTDKTLVTGFGAIVGTLEYMSPEQAEVNQIDIDTRSDIYSLGVLLYELLTGSPPFTKKDLEKAGMLEMLRVIREQEPSKPSTKLSTAEGLPTLAANRGTEPAKLTKLVRGELDWIVMKALEKDRNRRYETANGFAMDIQRYLADEAVLACPPSAGYRLRKFARRNKGALLAVAVFLLLLVGGVVGTTLGLLQARKSEDHAQAEARVAGHERDNAITALASETKALKAEKQTSYYLGTSLALNEYRTRNVERASAILDESPEDLRHWEWHYLNRLCRSELASVKIAGSSAVYLPEYVAISGATKRIAVLDLPAKLCAFDAVSGQELPGVKDNAGFVRPSEVAISANGQRMACAAFISNQIGVKIRDTQTGKEIAELLPVQRMNRCSGVALSPDGELAAATDMRGELNVWEVSTHKQRFRVAAHPLPDAKPFNVWSTKVAFNHDGTRVATACEEDMPVQVWDAANGERMQTLDSAEGYSRVVFSPKGTWVAAAGKCLMVREPNLSVRVWEAATRKSRVLRGYDKPVTCLAFSPDERLLATGSQDDTLTLWDVESGRLFANYRGHERGVAGVAFTPDGKQVVSLSGAGVVKTWDATRAPEFLPLNCKTAFHATFSPDSRFVAAAAAHATENAWRVVICDAATGKEVAGFGDNRTTPNQVAYSPDGRLIAAAIADGNTGFVRVWNVESRKVHRDFPGAGEPPIGPCFALAYSPDGKLLAAGGGDQLVHVWDVATGDEKYRFPGHQRTLSELRFSGDSRRLVSGTGGLSWDPGWPPPPADKNPLNLQGDRDDYLRTGGKPADVKVWDLDTKEVLFSKKWSARPRGLAISPDGRALAIAELNNTVRLYAVATRKEMFALKAHSREAWGVAFTPDGTRLVTGGGDEFLKLWDAKTGQLILSIGSHPPLIRGAAFSPDGWKIVTAGDGVRVWDATPGKK
jgi:WD40 repeat protein/serine/threonine protein kinase